MWSKIDNQWGSIKQTQQQLRLPTTLLGGVKESLLSFSTSIHISVGTASVSVIDQLSFWPSVHIMMSTSVMKNSVDEIFPNILKSGQLFDKLCKGFCFSLRLS